MHIQFNANWLKNEIKKCKFNVRHWFRMLDYWQIWFANSFYSGHFQTGATTADLPPGVLYRVKATYKYVKEDQDELSFDVGEIIRVIEYDDPDDQVRHETLRSRPLEF